MCKMTALPFNFCRQPPTDRNEIPGFVDAFLDSMRRQVDEQNSRRERESCTRRNSSSRVKVSAGRGIYGPRARSAAANRRHLPGARQDGKNTGYWDAPEEEIEQFRGHFKEFLEQFTGGHLRAAIKILFELAKRACPFILLAIFFVFCFWILPLLLPSATGVLISKIVGTIVAIGGTLVAAGPAMVRGAVAFVQRITARKNNDEEEGQSVYAKIE